jgi:hypothetical protein
VRILAAIAAGVAFACYVASASPWVSFWDIGENQTVPYILGIAHPTGFPFFTLLGWVYTHAIPFGTVAWRMNVFSGLWIAAAAAGVVLLAGRLGASRSAALFAALAFAFGPQAWFQGSHADAHALLAALMVFGVYFAVRFASTGRAQDAIGASLCTGLGLATHPEAMFVLPALALAWAARVRHGLSARTALAALAALLAPFLLYAYFPLRSVYVAAHGLDPTALPPLYGTGTLVWDTSHPRTLAGFLAEVSGGEYRAGAKLVRAFDVRRYLGAVGYWVQFARIDLPLVALVLAALGAGALVLRDRWAAAIALAPVIGMGIFTSTYTHETPEASRYLLPSFAIVAALAAASVQLRVPVLSAIWRGRLVAVVLAAAAASAAYTNRGSFNARHDLGGEPLIAAVARDLPNDVLVVMPWIDATPLAYGAFIEHRLPGKTIVLGWPNDHRERYATWTLTKRVFFYANPWVFASITDTMPASWLKELPTTLRGYRAFEVLPRAPLQVRRP